MRIVKNPHLWFIAILTFLIGIGYYGEQVGLDSWAPVGRGFFSTDYTHDVHRTLFLIPMLYAAAVFRLRGAIVISVLVFFIVLPRGLFVSELPDPLLRSVLTALITIVAALLLGLERERSYRLSHEIAMRKDAQEAQSRLAFIVESSDDAIIGKGLDGIIASWNVGAEKLYGYTAEEAVGQSVSILVPPGEINDTLEILSKIREGEEVHSYETIRITREGQIIDVSLKVSPIWNKDGQLVGVSTIARDITERKKAEVARRRLTSELTNRVKELNFLYEISRLASGPEKPIAEIFRETLALIPQAWLYPEITSARIAVDGQEYATDNFRQTPWKLLASIMVQGKTGGTVEVCYLEERPTIYEGPFLKEERNLLDTLARRLGYILERIQNQEAVRASEARFRELFNNMSSGVAVYEAIDDGNDFVFKDFNRAAEKIDHIAKEDVIGKKLTELFPGAQSFGILKILRGVWQTGQPAYLPESYYQDDRVSGWRENNIYRLPTGEVIGIYDDVTDRHKAQRDLAESQARYQSLFENASDGILVRDLDGNIVMVNDAMADISGYTVTDLQQMNVSRILNEESLPIVREKQARLLESEAEFTSNRYELTLLHQDGTERIIEAVTSLLTIKEQIMVQAIIRDVTEQRIAQEQMRSYASQITRAQEEERKRIARELHDETIQSLASLGMEIDAVINTCDKNCQQDVMDRLEELRHKMDGLLQSVRRITQDLRPPMLEDLGLIFALQWLAEDVGNQPPLNTRLIVTGDERRLAPEVEMLLFRIAQEALNNVRRHSKATESVVSIDYLPQSVTLSVTDNGQGFELSHLKRMEASPFGKLGIIGMEERARLLGGEFHIETRVNKGTTVSVSLKDNARHSIQY